MSAGAVAVVMVVMVGKSALQKHSSPFSYPVAAEIPPTSAGPPVTRREPSAVQVPSRAPSQFSGADVAPEVDLHEEAVQSVARRTPLHRGKAITSDQPATDLAAVAQDPA